MSRGLGSKKILGNVILFIFNRQTKFSEAECWPKRAINSNRFCIEKTLPIFASSDKRGPIIFYFDSTRSFWILRKMFEWLWNWKLEKIIHYRNIRWFHQAALQQLSYISIGYHLFKFSVSKSFVHLAPDSKRSCTYRNKRKMD